VAFTYLYGTFGLVWEADPGMLSSGISLREIITSRHQFLHQVAFHLIWAQVDVVAAVLASAVVINLSVLYFKPPIARERLIIADHKGE